MISIAIRNNIPSFKTLCIYIIIFVVIIVSYGLYGYFSVEPLPKNELIKRGVEFFDRNRKDFNSIVNALHLLKFPRTKDVKLRIQKYKGKIYLEYLRDDSLFCKVNESVYDSIVSLVNYHKELCSYCWLDSSGNFSYLSDSKYLNINREHYWIAYVVNKDDFNWYKRYEYHFYPHDSIPLEETNWKYQIEGNWYLISP